MFGKKEIDEKLIVMQYPSIGGNRLCDGREHSIKPLSLGEFYFGGRRFYILGYDDITMGATGCTTILVAEGNNLYKVPLESYDGLTEFIIRAKPRNVGLGVLNGIERIGSKQPVRTIADINEAREEFNPTSSFRPRKPLPAASVETPPRTQTQPERIKPPRVNNNAKPAVIVYIGDDGNFYITPAAAHQILDINQNAYDQSPTYRLTMDQLLFIKEHYHIRWAFIKVRKNGSKGPGGPNGSGDDRTNMERLVDALSAMADRNHVDPYELIERFVPIHYVVVNCDDDYVYRGEMNPTHLTGGTMEYRYDKDGNRFIRLNGSVDANAYFDYLKDLIGADEANRLMDSLPAGADVRRRQIAEEHSIAIEDIPDFIGHNALYRFVGRWPNVYRADEVRPLDEEDNRKHTLSSSLLGYIDAECHTRANGKIEAFNVRDIRDRLGHTR